MSAVSDRPGGASERNRKPKRGTVAALRPTPAVAMLESAKVFDAAAYMAAKRVDAVLIVDQEGQLSGILTDKDMAYRVVAEGLDPKYITLASVMTRNPISVPASGSASDALNRMVAGHFRHLPVIQDEEDEDAIGGGGGVVGVLDITKCLYDALEKLDRSYDSSRRTIDAVIEAGSAAVNGPMMTGSAQAIARYAEILKNQLSGPDLGGLLSEQSTAPPVVSMNDTVLEAARRMQAGKETAALVFDVDSDPHEDGLGDLAGIFTSKDLVLRVVAAGLNPATTTVARVMTPHPDCVTPDTRVVEALRKMHAGRYLHLPVVDSYGVVEGLVDVLKLTYSTLSQLSSLRGDQEADIGPLWNRFWDTSASNSELDGMSGRRRMPVGGSASSSSSSLHRKLHPETITSSNSTEIFIDSPDHDDASVYPEDSASRITTSPTRAMHADMDTTAAIAAAAATAAGATAIPPTNSSITEGRHSYFPATFTFKLKDLDTGKVHRFQSSSYSLRDLATSIMTKLGPSHPRVESLVKGQKLSISYLDDEGDFVHLEHDEDIRESVDMARAAGWARVMISIDSQRVFPSNGGPALIGRHMFASSLASTRTASDGGHMTGSEAGTTTTQYHDSKQHVQKKPMAVYDSSAIVVPILIGSSVAVVCAFLLGRAFR